MIVLDGQNIIDISIQAYGSVEGLFDLIKDNDLSMDDNLEAGQELIIYPQKTVEKAVIKYLSSNKLDVATDVIEIAGDFNEDFNFDFY